MTIDGHTAGWVRLCDSGVCQMRIVFVSGNTCIDIDTLYDDDSDDYNQVMSLINSIRVP